MTDTEKQKISPEHTRRQRQGLWAGLLAIALCLGYMLIVWMSPNIVPIIYPLLILLRTNAIFPVTGGIAMVAFALVVFSARYGGRLLVSFTALLVCVALLMVSLMGWNLAPRIVAEQNSVLYNGHVYRLIITEERQAPPDPFLILQLYRVLQCDETGLLCKRYAVPSPFSNRYLAVNREAQLSVFDHDLYLQSEDTLYSLMDGSSIQIERR